LEQKDILVGTLGGVLQQHLGSTGADFSRCESLVDFECGIYVGLEAELFISDKVITTIGTVYDGYNDDTSNQRCTLLFTITMWNKALMLSTKAQLYPRQWFTDMIWQAKRRFSHW
jgi:hypothetical protein